MNIKFESLNQSMPYVQFKKFYDKAVSSDQENIDAMLIASYDKNNNQPDARYVNLKYIINKNFIFFSNYNSPKSKQFNENEKITAVIFWPKINTQIRMKALIKKTTVTFNNEYFAKRATEKNALSISSRQSKKINSFKEVLNNYQDTLNSKNLKTCPSYWGGFTFTPFYFEFWQGSDKRMNKRQVYEFQNKKWSTYILEP